VTKLFFWYILGMSEFTLKRQEAICILGQPQQLILYFFFLYLSSNNTLEILKNTVQIVMAYLLKVF
jgi:hypothetical protein